MKPPNIPEPPAAYGPTQYPIMGMNCSFWADTAVAAPSSAKPNRADLIAFMNCLLGRKGLECTSNGQGLAMEARVSMTMVNKQRVRRANFRAVALQH